MLEVIVYHKNDVRTDMSHNLGKMSLFVVRHTNVSFTCYNSYLKKYFKVVPVSNVQQNSQ